MAKVLKYGDVSGVEGDFKQAPVGLYYLRCESIEQKSNKAGDSQQYEVIFQPTKDANGKKLKETYGRLWYYAPVDPNANWARRLKELVAAFGLKPKGGNLAVIENKECLARLREGTDLNGDYRPNIGKLMPLPQDAEEEDEEEDDSNGSLDEMSRAELKAYIKENELEVKVLKSMSDDDLRAAIQEMEGDEEEEEEEPDEEEEEEEEEPEAEEEEDNYDDMSIKELKQELKDRELQTTGKRSVLVARLRTDDVEEPV